MKLEEFKKLMQDDEVIEVASANADAIYTASINCCSKEVKCMVIMEELAELQQVVSKFARGELEDMNMLLEEMADVINDIDMLQRLSGISDKDLLQASAVTLYREGIRRGIIKEEKNDMIEVIKYGSKKRVTCPGCGSVLSYDENEDVKKKPCKKFGLNEMYMTYEKCIECPVCKQQIALEPTVK